MYKSETRLQKLYELQNKLKYIYRDIDLLNTALTHSSYVNEKDMPVYQCNERLEFLGDAVLQMVTSEYLYHRFKEYPEGALTRIRASLVMGQALGSYAAELGLGNYMLMGKGEEASGGRSRTSILADAFEALIGAIYLDGGYAPIKDFIIRYINKKLPQLTDESYIIDCKTALQENVQSLGERSIQYRIVAQQGPDHDKTFHAKVYIDDKPYGEGIGKSKKEAEQRAARQALKELTDAEES